MGAPAGRAGLQQLGPVDAGPVAAPAGQPYEQALAHVGRRHRRRLLAALPLLDDLDARAVGAVFRGRLRSWACTASRAVGPRPRGPTRPGSPNASSTCWHCSWTGLTNADIAARLVISPRTADHHVSAILGKLEVRTRKEAAVQARRLGV